MRKSSLSCALCFSTDIVCILLPPSGPRLIGEKYYMIGGEDCALYNQTEEQKTEKFLAMPLMEDLQKFVIK